MMTDKKSELHQAVRAAPQAGPRSMVMLSSGIVNCFQRWTTSPATDEWMSETPPPSNIVKH